jgi:hypothetical protein
MEFVGMKIDGNHGPLKECGDLIRQPLDWVFQWIGCS